MTKTQLKDLKYYILAVIILLLLVIGFQYLRAKLFYGGDLRCVIAECRILK